MRCQMMRVISSPSISTTGFFTAIFAMADEPLLLRARTCGGESGMPWGRRLMARRATSRKSKTRAELRADRSMDFTRAQVHRRRAGVLERVCVCDQQTSGEIRGSARNCDHPGCRSAPPGLHVECMRHKETYEGMPGAGTDKTKNWIETPGPIIVLVEPQLGENIGAAARAMANFALKRLRLGNPRLASLNPAKGVAVAAYGWLKLACGGALPSAMPQRSPPAGKEQVQAFFAHLEHQLDEIEYFRPLEKRATMLVNLRNILARMQPTQQDIQTLHGIVVALCEGRKGPARGGVLDSEEATALRALLAEHGQGRVAGERGPVRGLARLLRRNPTDTERVLWQALTNDRRFAGKGIKRQVPVGAHLTALVSFSLRLPIERTPT